MAPRKRKDVHKALKQKGFRQSQKDHNKFVYFNQDAKKTSVWTKTSYGTSHKDITDINLGNMARQCRLSRSQFDRLLDCPLSRQEYEKILIENQEIAAGTDY